MVPVSHQGAMPRAGGSQAPLCPHPGPAGTHRVVSWLMLVKEELLKELILLLLRSLEKARASSFAKRELNLGSLPGLRPLPHLLWPLPIQEDQSSTALAGPGWRGRGTGLTISC